MNPYLLFFITFALINLADYLNTRSAIMFRVKASNPVEIHHYLEYLRRDIKTSPLSIEKNPIQRFFLERFGPKRGGELSYLIISLPYISITTYLIWKLYWLSPGIVAVLAFYAGMVFFMILNVQLRVIDYQMYRVRENIAGKIRNEESAKTGEISA